ncbi:MAG TPA: EAL domain-containing protein [Thermoanaerobaculia bacterium]
MISGTLLNEVLAAGGLTTLFQPIFEMHPEGRALFAVEALSRGPHGSNAERADVLFEYVRRKGKETEIDRACTLAALKAAANSSLECAISINVHAATLEHDEGWVDFITDACATSGLALGRLILEIVEQQKYWDERRFFNVIDRLRACGVRIAVDDIGLGYSNYRLLTEIRPEFLKIDRYFVMGCAEKPEAQAAIESIRLLAERLGGRVIAEGVETESDLRALSRLGIRLLQGFLLAPPVPVQHELALCAG